MSARPIAEWIDASNARLYNELVEVDSRLPQVLESVAEEIVRYDPSLPSWWEAEGMLPKLGTYLLRYVAPLHDLLYAEGRRQYTDVLTAELLSVFAWRSFDNCMDAHVSHKVAHLASLNAFARLSDYSQECWPTRKMSELLSHYVVMTEQALRETEDPVSIGDIWKRCSVLLYPVVSLASLSDTRVATFKAYINYSGLAHDIDDLFVDLAANVMSLPVSWLREANQHRKPSTKDIEAIYVKAQEAVRPLTEHFAAIDVPRHLPLVSRLLQDFVGIVGGR